MEDDLDESDAPSKGLGWDAVDGAPDLGGIDNGVEDPRDPEAAAYRRIFSGVDEDDRDSDDFAPSLATVESMSGQEIDALLDRAASGDVGRDFSDLDQAEAVAEAARRLRDGESMEDILQTDAGGDDRSSEAADKIAEYTSYWRDLVQRDAVERESEAIRREADALADAPIDFGALSDAEFDLVERAALEARETGESIRFPGQRLDVDHIAARLNRLNAEAELGR